MKTKFPNHSTLKFTKLLIDRKDKRSHIEVIIQKKYKKKYRKLTKRLTTYLAR